MSFFCILTDFLKLMGKFAIAMVMVIMNYSFKGDLIIAKEVVDKNFLLSYFILFFLKDD